MLAGTQPALPNNQRWGPQEARNPLKPSRTLQLPQRGPPLLGNDPSGVGGLKTSALILDQHRYIVYRLLSLIHREANLPF